MFMSDLARALTRPVELEFMAVSSYGSSTSSSGVVRILKDLDRDISGKHVLVVEDIIDSGLTLSWLLKNFAAREPASLEVVALLRKPDAVRVDVPVGYVGFDIPTSSWSGYGLDYAERYRDLPYVGPAATRGLRELTPQRPVRGILVLSHTSGRAVTGTPRRRAALGGWSRAVRALRRADLGVPSHYRDDRRIRAISTTRGGDDTGAHRTGRRDGAAGHSLA